jgi:membrane protein YdbS with pleckstrin-like domain
MQNASETSKRTTFIFIVLLIIATIVFIVLIFEKPQNKTPFVASIVIIWLVPVIAFCMREPPNEDEPGREYVQDPEQTATILV